MNDTFIILLYLLHIPRKKPRIFLSLGYIRINNIHKIYEKYPKQARAASSQNIFINMTYKLCSFPSWSQYYKATHKNDYQKETLGEIKPFWDDILPTPPTSFLRVWCGMCGMWANECLFSSTTRGGVSGSDKSAQGRSRRPVSGTYWGKAVSGWVWESPGPA